MKYSWLSAFFLCHCVFAYCPDEDLQVTFQGKLIEYIYPGPPNWESIKDGDKVNALSAKEQKRHYFSDDRDGVFYYKENGQRYWVEGACDTVAGG